MMCAITIVRKPVATFMVRKSASSEAPRTISGVDIGRNTKKLVVLRPRKP